MELALHCKLYHEFLSTVQFLARIKLKVLHGNQHMVWRLALKATTNNVSSEIRGCVRNLGEVKNQVLLSRSREAKAGEKENRYRLSQRSLASLFSLGVLVISSH